MTEYERLSLLLLAQVANGLMLLHSKPTHPKADTKEWEALAERNAQLLSDLTNDVKAAIARDRRAA